MCLSSCARSGASKEIDDPGLHRSDEPVVGKPPSVPAPLPAEISIEEAIQESFQRNLSLMAQRLSLSIADAAIVAAGISPNPVLSLDADHVNVARLSKDDLTEAAVRVDVPIVLGGKKDRRLEVAEKDRAIAEAQLADALRKLRQDVALACIDVLQARANLSLAGDNLKTFEDLVRINDRRVQAGAIATVEMTRSKVALLQFKSGVKRSELELSGAKTKLKVLLGRASQSGEVDLTDALAGSPVPSAPELAKLNERAVASRPDLHAMELAQARADADLRLQEANGVIDLSGGVEYRWNFSQPSERLLGFFVSFPIPIWNQNAGEIARAEAQKRMAARQLDALRADVLSDVRLAFDEFASARELVGGIEGELLKSAREVRDAEQRRYQTGATSFLEFLDAQRAFNEARQSLNDAQATYRRAVIHVNSAVGSEVLR